MAPKLTTKLELTLFITPPLRNQLTHDTTFKDMVLAIEKELTIVGCMAFIFKIILNTSTFLDQHWILSLEYADLLVPVTSFVYCFQGMGLIIVCSIQTDFWSKGYYLDVYALLEPFYDMMHKAWYTKFFWVPFVSIRAQLEFRIFHDIFCEAYNINRKAFAFNEYVRVVWENYLIKLVTIPMTAWLLVIFLVFLEFARQTWSSDIVSGCGERPSADDDHRRRLSWGSEEEVSRRLAGGDDNSYGYGDGTYWDCAREKTSTAFLYFGWGLCLLCFFMCCLCRYYEIKILTSRGITCVEDYPVFLEVVELDKKERASEGEVIKGHGQKLSEKELRDAIEGMRRVKRGEAGAHAHGHGHGDGHGPFATVVKAMNKVLGLIVKTFRQSIALSWYALKALTHSLFTCDWSGRLGIDHEDLIALQAAHDEEEAVAKVSTSNVKEGGSDSGINSADNGTAGGGLSRHESIKLLTASEESVDAHMSSKGKGKANKEAFDGVSAGAMNVIRGAKLKLKKYTSVAEIDMLLQRLKTVVTTDHEADFKSIFLFNSPRLFYFFVEHLMMLISLYIALWLTHFVSHADLLFESAEGMGRFVTILPGIISSFLYALVVRSTVLLQAVTHLDTDVLYEVLEISESSRDLGRLVQQKMLRRLTSLGEPEKHLRLLFDEIDVDGSQVLSRDEFISFCAVMNVTFSKKKWRQIFREIDRDANDEISYEELHLFLFPDNNAALSQEKRRAVQRQRTVEIKRNLYAQKSVSREKNMFGGGGSASPTTQKRQISQKNGKVAVMDESESEQTAGWKSGKSSPSSNTMEIVDHFDDDDDL